MIFIYINKGQLTKTNYIRMNEILRKRNLFFLNKIIIYRYRIILFSIIFKNH